MRHAWLQKLQRFQRKMTFYSFLILWSGQDLSASACLTRHRRWRKDATDFALHEEVSWFCTSGVDLHFPTSAKVFVHYQPGCGDLNRPHLSLKGIYRFYHRLGCDERTYRPLI